MKRFFAGFFLLPALALAQPVSPNDQAMAQKLMADLQTEVQLRAEVIDLQTKLKAAQDHAAELQKQVDAVKPDVTVKGKRP